MENNFGIIGLGNIANKFADTLNKLHYNLLGVASRDYKKAQIFAKKYKATFAYDNYEELLNNKDINIIYIATPHGLHYDHLKLCLKYNKNIICEKAFTLNSKQAKEIFEIAKFKKCLVMEAMWTRFLPAINKIKDIINSNKYGQIKKIEADFCFYGNQDESYRLKNNILGGGALLDVGIYPITLVNLLLGTPLNIEAKGTLTENRIDLDNHIIFKYHNGVIAKINSSFIYSGKKEALITLENAIIRLYDFWKCENFEIYEIDTKKTLKFSIPFEINGFEYQIGSFIQTLNTKELENKIMSHETTIKILNIMDEIRKQLGVIYINE